VRVPEAAAGVVRGVRPRILADQLQAGRFGDPEIQQRSIESFHVHGGSRAHRADPATTCLAERMAASAAWNMPQEAFGTPIAKSLNGKDNFHAGS
jgi:hypothetical protein